jgi:hypothetical protein
MSGFGSDFCASATVAGAFGEAACTVAAVSGAGCDYDPSLEVCFQPASNCDQTHGAAGNEAACNGLAAQGCFWKEDGKCDPYDAASCTGEDTEFYKCSHLAWDTLVQQVLSAVDPLDPNTWDVSSLVDSFATMMTTGCFSKYRECFFNTECGNPELAATNFCKDTLTELCTLANNDSCNLDWCTIGVTQGKSIIDVAMTFADDFEWDDAKILELRETIEMLAGGGFDIDWIKFDQATGKISITIPKNEVVSQAEIDDIIKRLQEMLTGAEASLMTSDKGFAVKTVAVTSDLATIDGSKKAWENEVDGAGSSVKVGAAASAAVVGAAVAVMLM